MPAAADLTGIVMGRLTVLRLDTETPRTHRDRLWVCQCSCGNLISVRAHRLTIKSGGIGHTTRSCGCLQREASSAHGKKRSRHAESVSIDPDFDA